MLSGVASGSSVPTSRLGAAAGERLSALDFRASLTVGKLIGEVVAPYLTARGFGGPVFWRYADRDVTGSDQNHYQVGAGLLSAGSWLDAYVEIVPLGERAVAMGLSASF